MSVDFVTTDSALITADSNSYSRVRVNITSNKIITADSNSYSRVRVNITSNEIMWFIINKIGVFQRFM